MKLGTVTGKVIMQRSVDCLQGETVLLVETECGSLAVLDKAGARPGDKVLLAMGPGAQRYSMEVPADAVAVAVVKQ